MIVYISGPITGKRNNNRRNFTKALEKIRAALAGSGGAEIINPNDIGAAVDQKFTDINKDRVTPVKPQWEDYMRSCIRRLCEADFAYFLKGWEKSKGASLERHIAVSLGIPCVENIGELIKIKEQPEAINENS